MPTNVADANIIHKIFLIFLLVLMVSKTIKNNNTCSISLHRKFLNDVYRLSVPGMDKPETIIKANNGAFINVCGNCLWIIFLVKKAMIAMPEVISIMALEIGRKNAIVYRLNSIVLLQSKIIFSFCYGPLLLSLSKSNIPAILRTLIL